MEKKSVVRMEVELGAVSAVLLVLGLVVLLWTLGRELEAESGALSVVVLALVLVASYWALGGELEV